MLRSDISALIARLAALAAECASALGRQRLSAE
jgi:hypothetical protein